MPGLGGQRGTPEPLFASEPVTGVSQRRVPLPSAFEVAPIVAAYLRQTDSHAAIPSELETMLRGPIAAPARSRETVILVWLAVLLFAAAFALAIAVLPQALK